MKQMKDKHFKKIWINFHEIFILTININSNYNIIGDKTMQTLTKMIQFLKSIKVKELELESKSKASTIFSGHHLQIIRR
jgi:hypothetical protein